MAPLTLDRDHGRALEDPAFAATLGVRPGRSLVVVGSFVPRAPVAPRRRAITSLTGLMAMSIVCFAAPALARNESKLGTTSVGPFTQLADPARTVAAAADGSWLATFTDGSRTVVLRGPSRTFGEPTTSDAVISSTWVRLLAAPFGGEVDRAWLAKALVDRSPDLLAIATEYLDGSPPISDVDGRRIAGDAAYGPLRADGTRAEGSDFNDYLGRTWTYRDGFVDPPEPDQAGALDCSGFVRMVFGFRSGLPLSLRPDGRGLPRQSFEQLAAGPGVVVLPDRGTVPGSRSRLQPGDLVFFDASTDDGSQIDHVGIFLGRDTAGNDRLITSRQGANGPTLGDTRGRSILNGSGLYATAFRAARRL
jgi:hypothetical protein